MIANYRQKNARKYLYYHVTKIFIIEWKLWDLKGSDLLFNPELEKSQN